MFEITALNGGRSMEGSPVAPYARSNAPKIPGGSASARRITIVSPSAWCRTLAVRVEALIRRRRSKGSATFVASVAPRIDVAVPSTTSFTFTLTAFFTVLTSSSEIEVKAQARPPLSRNVEIRPAARALSPSTRAMRTGTVPTSTTARVIIASAVGNCSPAVEAASSSRTSGTSWS